MKWLWLVFASLLGFAVPAGAQTLVSALSDQQIAISSGFSGQNLTLFGNIEPTAGTGEKTVQGPFDILIAIVGPPADRVARRKERRLGIWVNAEQVTFRGLPTFFHLASNRPLKTIANAATLDDRQLTLLSRTRGAAEPDAADADLFSRQLVRLMERKGYFGADPAGVRFLSDTFYTARVALPADVPNGTFLAETYLFKQGEMIGYHAETFSVRKIGFERFVGSAAIAYPWAYGLAAVLLAIGTGWLGGVVFRR